MQDVIYQAYTSNCFFQQRSR